MAVSRSTASQTRACPDHFSTVARTDIGALEERSHSFIVGIRTQFQDHVRDVQGKSLLKLNLLSKRVPFVSAKI